MDGHSAGVGLVAGVWSESAAAERSLHAFRAGGSVGPTGIHGAVTLVVDQVGDLRITDLAGRTADGAVGNLLGATLGLLIGGIGWLPLDADRLDTLAAEARWGGLPDGPLLRLGERIKRRSSALVAVVGRSWLDVAVLALETAGAETLPQPADDVLLARLGAREPAWPGRTEIDDVIAMRSGAVVMRALESSSTAMA